MDIAGASEDIPMEGESKNRSRSSSGATFTSPPQPVITVAGQQVLEEEADPQQLLIMFDEVQGDQLTGEISPMRGETTPERRSSSAMSTPEHGASTTEQGSETQPVFFKSVECSHEFTCCIYCVVLARIE